MKTRKSFRLLALLLALCALLSLSVFAVGGEGGIEPHGNCSGNHTWKYYYTTYKCESRGASGHCLVTTVVYECTGCGVLDSSVTEGDVEPHSLSTVLLSHQHLKGTIHIATWRERCSVDECGYSRTYSETYTCPGNPSGEGCIMP